MRAGTFTLFPSVALGETYDDNIFATGSDRSDDFVTTIVPALRAQSDWAQHSLTLTARSEIGRFLRSGNEDYEDFNIGANGTLDVTRQTKVTGGLSLTNDHEERGSANDVNGRTPTEFNTVGGNLGLSHKFNRVTLGVDGGATDYDYNDVSTSIGTIINNDDRDRREYTASARAAYEIQENYEAFVRGSWNRRTYDTAVDDAGINRDSKGYGTDLGIRIDLTGITQAELFAGWYKQNYTESTLKDPDGINYGANIIWNATALTTVRLNLARNVTETTIAAASSSVDTNAGVRVDHELRRNILLNGRVGYTNTDYQGGGRDDDIFDSGVGARYLINRNFAVEGDYRYLFKDSTDTTAGYVRNQFSVKLITQL